MFKDKVFNLKFVIGLFFLIVFSTYGCSQVHKSGFLDLIKENNENNTNFRFEKVHDPILDIEPKGFVAFYYDLETIPVSVQSKTPIEKNPKNPLYCYNNCGFWSGIRVFKLDEQGKICRYRKVTTKKGDEISIERGRSSNGSIISDGSITFPTFPDYLGVGDYWLSHPLRKVLIDVENPGTHTYRIGSYSLCYSSLFSRTLLSQSETITINVYDKMVTPVKIIVKDIKTVDLKRGEMRWIEYSYSKMIFEVGEPFHADYSRF